MGQGIKCSGIMGKWSEVAVVKETRANAFVTVGNNKCIFDVIPSLRV